MKIVIVVTYPPKFARLVENIVRSSVGHLQYIVETINKNIDFSYTIKHRRNSK